MSRFEVPTTSHRYRLYLKSPDIQEQQLQEIKESCPAEKLIVFVGESASGKSTLINELISKFPDEFERVTTCTSRKPRDGEENGVDYHFMPREYFIDNPELVIVVESANGDLYGTRIADLFSEGKHKLLPSVPEGVDELIALGFTNLAIVQMHVSEEEKIKRMRARGESDEQVEKRTEKERAFRKVKNDVSAKIIEIDSESLTPEDALQLILKLLDCKKEVIYEENTYCH